MERFPFKEMNLDDVCQILDLTIKEDRTNKLLIFLAMLSAFTDDSQINITLNAPSSAGKTFLTNEIVKFFPKEDTIVYSKITPTAFHYSAKLDKDRGVRIMNLERKILVFQEQPDAKVQENLRSILSHDRKEANFCLTNRSKSGENRAEEVVIRGFPATIFCSANSFMDEQESTRAIMLSPEVSNEKIELAKLAVVDRESNPERFRKEICSNVDRQLLQRRIRAIRDMQVGKIGLSDQDLIIETFNGMVDKPRARHSRDMKHFIDIVKSMALLNIWYRKNDEGQYYANEKDVMEAASLWKDIAKTQCLSLPPYVAGIYYDVIIPLFNQKRLVCQFGKINSSNSRSDIEQCALTRQEILNRYVQTKRTILQDWQMKRLLSSLEAAGLIQIIESKNDRRLRLIVPLEVEMKEERWVKTAEKRQNICEKLVRIRVFLVRINQIKTAAKRGFAMLLVRFRLMHRSWYMLVCGKR